MGLFDFFKNRKPPGEAAPEEKWADKKLASLAKKASSKKLQPFDRDEAIRGVLAIGTHEAAIALLKRFSLTVDPSITDQEEKQLVFEGIVSIGRGQRGKRVSDAGKDPKEVSDEPLTKEEIQELRDAIIERTRAYCEKADNLTWPLKVMRALLPDEEYETELLDLLGEWDTEYSRNVEPKLNILHAMEDIHSDAIREAVEEYLDDVNETVRFHAVQTTFAQDDASSVPALVTMMQNEESVRVKNKVCAGIVKKGWAIPEDRRDDCAEAMSDVYEYAFDASSGKIGKA
jgi:hypothetical protein